MGIYNDNFSLWCDVVNSATQYRSVLREGRDPIKERK